jgi:hypothetical protein
VIVRSEPVYPDVCGVVHAKCFWPVHRLFDVREVRRRRDKKL